MPFKVAPFAPQFPDTEPPWLGLQGIKDDRSNWFGRVCVTVPAHAPGKQLPDL